jgi:flagellar basal-body rod protein FlgB
MNFIEPVTMALVSKALDAATVRQAVHANNIANASADGFAPSRVSFEAHMSQVRDALARGDRLAASDVSEIQASIETLGVDTKVELDTEISALARNGLHYQALIKALDRQLSMMSMAVSDGKR